MKQKVANAKWVTESALIARINERLADDSQKLKEFHMAGSPSFGHFYEQPVAEHGGSINLETIGREMGVLAPDESIAESTRRPAA